ncbi:hypothetical protein HRR86_004796 [Exophiala dermatitidis]|nr:hypothetical protein HRR77_003435 [Exophiala dermatitidis]KAJ4560964.1 hypothetical protein HRR79_007526 [Exophiala dermatitidis]KAJ4561137.1 hypothetical protein HRR79_007365 [Exophiala dermatitidis]KAJ4569142.1 hypothetical protein HRR82_007775 [Exophiala dermatitidis]KAJ4617657.1 hypothetical protein HRR85_002647 [Exophiala dermatitidis]
MRRPGVLDHFLFNLLSDATRSSLRAVQTVPLISITKPFRPASVWLFQMRHCYHNIFPLLTSAASILFVHLCLWPAVIGIGCISGFGRDASTEHDFVAKTDLLL